jgi:prolyl oligopeptidase
MAQTESRDPLRKPLLSSAAARPFSPPPPPRPTDDPYLWLEEIEGAARARAGQGVEPATEDLLTRDPRNSRAYRRARSPSSTTSSRSRLPTSARRQGRQPVARREESARAVAGLAARRLSRRQAAMADPDRRRRARQAEGKSWVWHGADCLAPEYRRCLVSLSPGGTDADVVREFDLGTGKFVEGGFTLPEAKSNTAWVDRDTSAGRTDYGPAADHLGLSADRQAVEARHAAQRRADPVHGRDEDVAASRSRRSRRRHALDLRQPRQDLLDQRIFC